MNRYPKILLPIMLIVTLCLYTVGADSREVIKLLEHSGLNKSDNTAKLTDQEKIRLAESYLSKDNYDSAKAEKLISEIKPGSIYYATGQFLLGRYAARDGKYDLAKKHFLNRAVELYRKFLENQKKRNNADEYKIEYKDIEARIDVCTEMLEEKINSDTKVNK